MWITRIKSVPIGLIVFFLGADAKKFRGRRFAIINVWFPVTGPLRDHQLAVCDVQSILPEDYVHSKAISLVDENGPHIGHGHVEEALNYLVHFNTVHRWYYAPDMMLDEALLLRNYDSATDDVSRFSPHFAFDDPTTPASALPRASIEVRALVIW
jgi:hypothetical protein